MAAVVALEELLAARTLWHAGRSARQAADGEPTGHAALDALLPQGGWPRRALTELLLPADGVGELALLMPTLARCTRAGERVAVIAPPYVPYAPAWQASGLDLSRLCIVEAAPRDALWAFEQCLRSGACAAVLGWPQQADARALRRLQVAADSGRCLGFALRDRRHAANASPAALRLEAVRGERGIAWHVRKCRGGPVPSAPFVPERDARFEDAMSMPAWVETQPAPRRSAVDAGRDARLACLREARASMAETPRAEAPVEAVAAPVADGVRPLRAAAVPSPLPVPAAAGLQHDLFLAQAASPLARD